MLPAFGVGNYYWKQYTGTGLFDLEKKYRDYTAEERHLLLFGSRKPGGPRENKRMEGIKTQFQRLCLMKGPEEQNDHTLKKLNQFMEEKTCPDGGTSGGQVVFTGTPREMVEQASTITAEYLIKSM